jgi:thiamine-phosphate pyrophosphorylase
MNDLYALCDRELLERFHLSLEDFVDAAKLYGAKIIQYRDKKGSVDERYENLKKLRSLWDGTLIINDEIALSRFCDGVHIGQEDLLNIIEHFGARSAFEAITLIKKMIGAKIIGLSTHSLKEITAANELEIDYIGLGAYRVSSTKEVERVLGDKLPLLAASSRHKVVAIGGIRLFEYIPNVWLKAVGTDLCIKALTYA